MMTWWLRPALTAIAVAGLWAALAYYGHERYEAGYEAHKAQRESLDQRGADKAHAAERVLLDKLNAAQLARQTDKVEYETTIDGLRAAARRGAVGMRVPATPGADACANTAVASGPGGEAGYALMPETTVDILDIAAGIRQSVLDYNALIDTYAAARSACNAQ